MPAKKRNYRSDSLRERFWAGVNLNGPVPFTRPDLGNCWVWTKFVDKNGYGRLRRGRRSEPVAYAHHVALELQGVETPAGYERDHLCSVRSCCRPSHIDTVLHVVNVRRGTTSRRNLACGKGHDTTEGNTYRSKRGKPSCRTCAIDRARVQRDRRRIAQRIGVAIPSREPCGVTETPLLPHQRLQGIGSRLSGSGDPGRAPYDLHGTEAPERHADDGSSEVAGRTGSRPRFRRLGNGGLRRRQADGP